MLYLGRIEKNAGVMPTRMDEILESHFITPQFLRRDDFLAFFTAREKALLGKEVEAVMGKPIAHGLSQPASDEPDDYEERTSNLISTESPGTTDQLHRNKKWSSSRDASSGLVFRHNVRRIIEISELGFRPPADGSPHRSNIAAQRDVV